MKEKIKTTISKKELKEFVENFEFVACYEKVSKKFYVTNTDDDKSKTTYLKDKNNLQFNFLKSHDWILQDENKKSKSKNEKENLNPIFLIFIELLEFPEHICVLYLLDLSFKNMLEIHEKFNQENTENIAWNIAWDKESNQFKIDKIEAKKKRKYAIQEETHMKDWIERKIQELSDKND